MTHFLRLYVCLLILRSSFIASSQSDDVESQGPTCGICNSTNLYNDMIYLIESSDATEKLGVGDMWAFVLTVSQQLNIQKRGYPEDNFVQNGVIAYSDGISTVAELGSVDNCDMLNLEIPFLGGGLRQTNLSQAIVRATEQFTQYGRRNSRKIIIVLAITYNSEGTYSAEKTSSTFKEDGGILMIYNYVRSNKIPNDRLIPLASSGYYFSSLTATVEDLIEAQCDANCFCPYNFLSFKSSVRNKPLHGCYYPVDLPSNFAFANSNCAKNYQKGYIASAQSLEKQQFLKNQIMDENMLIGLHNVNDNWVWSNEQELGKYHPWIYTPTPSQIICIRKNETSWTPTDKREGFWYLCETIPCSCNNFCDTPIKIGKL